MAGSEELGLREDTLRVLAAFLQRGEAAGSPIPTSPRSPAQEEPTDFLSRLRRCLPCPLGREAVPPESPRPCSLPLRPCYDSQPAGLGPCPALQAGPPLRWLFRPPSGTVFQPGGQPSPQPCTSLLAMPQAPAAFPRAPGPPGLGDGAESACGSAGGNPGWTQRGARAQLHALDPGPRGLGGHPGSFACGLELPPGLRSSSAAAARSYFRSPASLCAF
ncbi:bcl-2-like protein 12 isoform 3-T8 [Rhynchonycteris naso]